jgi:F-type H+-transporting ATPase subunit b
MRSSRFPWLVLAAIVLMFAGPVPARAQSAADEPAATAQATAAEQPATAEPPAAAEHDAAPHGEAAEGEHGSSLLSTVARLVNFAILAWVLVYFLRAPIQNYLAGRSRDIREDLESARALRARAAAQVAEIERQLAALPGELEALRARGSADLQAERERLAQAAAAVRQRLLEHTRREIELKLRVARRDLVEYAADLAVDVARSRIATTITPDDQLRLVDRYAGQLQEAR